MSVLRSGPYPVSGERQVAGRSRDVSYLVVCSTTTESIDTVLDHVAATYGVYPTARLAETDYYCHSVRATQQRDGKLWTVTGRYMLATFSLATVSAVSPLEEPWRIRFGRFNKRQVATHAFSSWKKIMYADNTMSETIVPPGPVRGVPILNSAGHVFDPAHEEETGLLQIMLEKNLSTSAYASIKPLTYHGTINESAIQVAGHSIGPYTGKLEVEGSRVTYVNSAGLPQFYMGMQFVLTIDPQTWALRLVDMGMQYKIRTGPDAGKMRYATQSGFSESREIKPVKLNGLGESLADANAGLGEGQVAGLACLMCFFQNPAANWGPLDFPSSVTTK